MKVTSLKIPEVKLLEPDVFEDERGHFFESFNQKEFNELVGPGIKFVQDNQSSSKKGVLRGLHFQESPYEQGKLIKVISGKVYDVALDLRNNSETFGRWLSIVLSANNKGQLWIPPGFAHGFLALEENTEISYKVTNFYNKNYEKNIPYNSKEFNIEWPELEHNFILSKKDSQFV